MGWRYPSNLNTYTCMIWGKARASRMVVLLHAVCCQPFAVPVQTGVRCFSCLEISCHSVEHTSEAASDNIMVTMNKLLLAITVGSYDFARRTLAKLKSSAHVIQSVYAFYSARWDAGVAHYEGFVADRNQKHLWKAQKYSSNETCWMDTPWDCKLPILSSFSNMVAGSSFDFLFRWHSKNIWKKPKWDAQASMQTNICFVYIVLAFWS